MGLLTYHPRNSIQTLTRRYRKNSFLAWVRLKNISSFKDATKLRARLKLNQAGFVFHANKIVSYVPGW